MDRNFNNSMNEYVEDVYYELAAKHLRDNDGSDRPLLLKYMLTIEEAEIGCYLPATLHEIAEKSNIEKDKAKEIIISMVEKGTVQFNHETERAFFMSATIFLVDYGMATTRYDKERGKKYFELLRNIRMSKDYLEKLGKRLKMEGETGKIFRILPKYDAIKNIPGVMPSENLKDILEEYDGQISCVRCICRTSMENPLCRTKESMASPEEGFCFKLGEVAKHYVEEIKAGRYLSANEALELISRLNKTPSYHLIGNARKVMAGFCNCCSDCCEFRMGLNEIGDVKEGIVPSRFLCKCDSDKCNVDNCKDCNECAKYCTFNAISFDADGKAIIDSEKCMGCGSCVVNCPTGALELELVRPVDHIPTDGKQYIYDSLQTMQPKNLEK